MKHGTGGINIDGSRIPFVDENVDLNKKLPIQDGGTIYGGGKGFYRTEEITEYKEGGRFPANIIFDEESGQLLGEPSRFLYCPKAAKKDRSEGIELINNHPTVKPTDLMRYLINLVTPPNGTTLDPFMGSGSTGKAAVRCGVKFIGIEKEQEYMDIATARINHELNKL